MRLKIAYLNYFYKKNFRIVLLIIFVFTLFFISETNAQQISGKELFLSNRCANCHTIGRGKFVGPDLYKVSKRYSKQGIITWMLNSQDIYKQKDKMSVNEGYPPMPPMNVVPEQAELIYDYLKDFKIPKGRLEKGIIKGVVSNDTLKKEIDGLDVKLTSYLGDISRDEFSIKTDSKGQYVFKNLKYPAINDHIEGTAVVQFIVEKDGSLTDIKIRKGLSSGLGSEIVSVVKSMSRWIPGKQFGKSVRIRFTLPIKIRLE